MDAEGLYRVPGNRAHVDLLFQQFDEDKVGQGGSIEVKNGHVVQKRIFKLNKGYLRSLKNNLGLKTSQKRLWEFFPLPPILIKGIREVIYLFIFYITFNMYSSTRNENYRFIFNVEKMK